MSEYTNDFAIVSEGVTDYAVLKNILLGYFKGKGRDPRISQKQPSMDATMEGDPEWRKFGTWENVFRYLKEGKHRDALSYNKYILVQIDTDLSEHPNFGVAHREGNRVRSPKELVVGVRDRLRQEMGEADFAEYGARFVFAICVHAMECWLLPLWVTDVRKASKITGCLDAVNRALAKKNEPPLPADGKKAGHYLEASRHFKQKGVFREMAQRNPSLKVFFDELERLNIELTEDPD